MKTSKIAKRYAKALFDFAKEQNLIDKVFADLNLINDVYASCTDFALAMQSPIIRPYKKIKILNEIFAGKIDDITMKYLEIITKKGRELHIELIIIDYILLYKEFNNIKIAILITATPATDELKQKVIDTLSLQLNSKIELVERINPELIGGFIIHVGDKVFDSSLIGKIKKLEQEFSVNIYNKAF